MKTTILLLFLGVSLLVNGQSIRMQGKVPQFFNPALTGAFNSGQINVLSGISYKKTPFNFNYVGFNTRINKIKSGIGFHYYDYREYTTIPFYNAIYNIYPKVNTVGISYAFQQNLGEKWTMALGGSANYSHRVEDWENFSNENNVCDICPTTKRVDNYFDYIGGLMFYSNKGYFQATVTHFSNFYVPLSIKIGGGHTTTFKKDTTNVKSLTISYELTSVAYILDFRVSALYRYNSFNFGLLTGLVHGFSIGFQAGYTFKNKYQISYSLFKPVAINYNYLGNEISLRMNVFDNSSRPSNAFKHLLY